jgi:hypothetical protein
MVGFLALTVVISVLASVENTAPLATSVDSNESSILVLPTRKISLEKNESKWDQQRNRMGAVVESAKALFASHPAKVSEVWKKINSSSQNIGDVTRGECAQEFVTLIQSGQVNEALRYLAAAKLNVFDKTTDNKTRVFKTLVTEFKNTSEKEEEKRALILFSLYNMYIFSLKKIPDSPRSQRNKGVKKKKKALRAANDVLQDILTEETVRKHV